ncbi:hypothetical protein GCM10023191_102060 [Actinoallomurus oryzae]|uniref:Uncharacterized protein n=1 Tax=Actinoallomurus oryzae TaxID=502180 RepID=A0ABP8R9N1_9ACTN
MTSIDLEIYSDDPNEVAALEAYWRLADDGESWAQTVTAIRSELGLKPQEMTRIVQTCATAYLPEITCPQCGDPHAVTSRTNFAEVVRQGNVLCSTCRAAAHEEQKRAEKERAARRRAAVAELFQVMPDGPIDVQDLTLFEAVALHALFSDPAVEDVGMTTPTDIWPKERPWAPGRLRWDFERRLVQAAPPKMLAHPDSHPDAFVWENDSLTGAFYLGKVSYYLLGPQEDLSARPPSLLNELNRVFREGPWPKAWLRQWPDLWDELVLADASAYLDMKLGEHRLEMKQGDGTLAALADALATFSLGQVFNFIYRAAKDSAAYYQRGGVNKRQAANSTVGRISAAADRVRASGWEVKSFSRPWNLPLSAIGETFFSKVMWQADMMPVTAQDAHPPLHASAEGDPSEPSA